MSGGPATKHEEEEAEEDTPSTNTAIQAAQLTIAPITASVVVLEEELKQAKAERNDWNAVMKKAIIYGKVSDALLNLREQQAIAIKAARQGPSRVGQGERRLQEEKRLLQEKEKLVAQNGKPFSPFTSKSN